MSVFIPLVAILAYFGIAYLFKFLSSVLPDGVRGINSH